MSNPSPIFIMSFDRPGYLSRVLESLCQQDGVNLRERTVVLFQDGAFNPFSKRMNAAEDRIRECVELFRSAVPFGKVAESPMNLGVALNFERAERFGFEELGADAAIFLEDDLVLGKHYISTVDALVRTFLTDPRVGYVAAYGDHTKSLEQQRENRRRLVLLTHNWGFALFRRQWLRMRRRVLEYLQVIAGCDYRDRDAQQVRALYASWGYGCPAISQDAAKSIACCADGVVKLNTYACHAAYIGEVGLHMNPGIYAQRGYQHTVLYPEKISGFEMLDTRLYESLLREQRGWARAG